MIEARYWAAEITDKKMPWLLHQGYFIVPGEPGFVLLIIKIL
jgi:hypothetical protein